ncbi:MAG: transposase [Nonomuraea muscovyensis]|nr:transposase [Nonomuraea muscovyensis]
MNAGRCWTSRAGAWPRPGASAALASCSWPPTAAPTPPSPRRSAAAWPPSKTSGAAPKLDGKATATLVGLACTTPPAGRATWTMRLLADRLVELGAIDAVSDETVRRRLKKTSSSPGSGSSGASPS